MITKFTMVLWKVISNSDITTTQTPLEIGIMNMLLNFQNNMETERSWKSIHLKMEYSWIRLRL